MINENRQINFDIRFIQSDFTKFNIEKDRNNNKLLIRKNYINSKLKKFRSQNNHKILSQLIAKIKINFKNENVLETILNEISKILSQQLNIQNNISIIEELMQNQIIHIMCNLSQIYFNSNNIIFYIINILLNVSHLLIENKNIFTSNDIYIDIYNKIISDAIKSKNKKILNEMVKFIGNISKKSKKNQLKLYMSQTLELIINSFSDNNDVDYVKTLVWCISQFDLVDKYEINTNLSLKIQKIYLFIFKNSEKYFQGEFNYFYIDYWNLVNNVSYCNSEEYLKNLIDNNFIACLLSIDINNINFDYIELILNFLGKITDSNNKDFDKELIRIGLIKFLLKISLNNLNLNFNDELRAQSLYPINNILINNLELCNIILFEENVIDAFCVLLKKEKINYRIFEEICYCFIRIVPYLKFEEIKILNEKYLIIQLLVCGFINYMKNEKNINNNIVNIINQINLFVSTILKFFEVFDENLVNKIYNNFRKEKGEEILEKILIIINRNDDFIESNNEIDITFKDIIKNIDDIKNKIKVIIESKLYE